MARKVNIGLIPQIIEEGPVPNHGLYITMIIPDDVTEQGIMDQTRLVLHDIGEFLVHLGDNPKQYNAFAEQIKEMFVNGQ